MPPRFPRRLRRPPNATAVNPATGLPLPVAPDFNAPAPVAAPGESVDANSINIKLTLNDVRLADLLDAIVLVADHPIKYSIEDYGIVFSARGADQMQYETRTFKIDPNTFYQGLESVGAVAFGSTIFQRRWRRWRRWRWRWWQRSKQQQRCGGDRECLSGSRLSPLLRWSGWWRRWRRWRRWRWRRWPGRRRIAICHHNQ